MGVIHGKKKKKELHDLMHKRSKSVREGKIHPANTPDQVGIGVSKKALEQLRKKLNQDRIIEGVD